MEPNETRDVDDPAGQDPLFEANITLHRGLRTITAWWINESTAM
jgi:hypothetical protein